MIKLTPENEDIFTEAIKAHTSVKKLREWIDNYRDLFSDEIIALAEARIAEITAEREETAAKLGLTVKSMLLLKRILNRASWDFDEDGEGFILLRDLPRTAESRGNLTDLKKKGFFDFTFTCDNPHRFTPDRDGYWVTLTQKGIDAQKVLAA